MVTLQVVQRTWFCERRGCWSSLNSALRRTCVRMDWVHVCFALLSLVRDVSSQLPKVCFPAIYKYYIWNKLTLSFIMAAWGASMMIVEIDKPTFPWITLITYGKSWNFSKARWKNPENVLASKEILQANFLLNAKRFHCWKCSIALFMIASMSAWFDNRCQQMSTMVTV